MSKMGVYGLFRILSLFTSVPGFQPPTWWGVLVLIIGMVSGVAGILSAVSQRQLRRILAYSSVENMGIIGIGLGTGLLGLSAQKPGMAVLGFAGALFHVLNHSLFKGLLFLGPGPSSSARGPAISTSWGDSSNGSPSWEFPSSSAAWRSAASPP